jgi:hypothetical protein
VPTPPSAAGTPPSVPPALPPELPARAMGSVPSAKQQLAVKPSAVSVHD